MGSIFDEHVLTWEMKIINFKKVNFCYFGKKYIMYINTQETIQKNKHSSNNHWVLGT